MDDFYKTAIYISIIFTVVFSIIVYASFTHQESFEHDLKQIKENKKLMDGFYFTLTTQENTTEFDSKISCKLREIYLQKYQHDWSNTTLKDIAYDMWINDCLLMEKIQ